jgi:hypothetical protein
MCKELIPSNHKKKKKSLDFFFSQNVFIVPKKARPPPPYIITIQFPKHYQVLLMATFLKSDLMSNWGRTDASQGN